MEGVTVIVKADRKTKDQRLSIRVSMHEKTTLERASQTLRMTTSEFVVRQAVESAEEILAERTRFTLPPERWEEFTARLDVPPRPIPALSRLMGEPSPFDEP
jgi:uncharacterized protein (DUF1778 family)